MTKRITENELVLPALYVIYLSKKANTTKIKEVLSDVFNPQGEDAKILSGRRDTKFSQIVRNLMGSHYESNHMSEYTKKDNSKYFTLTHTGLKYVEDNLSFLQYLFKNSFKYDNAIELSSKVFASKKTKRVLIYDEDDTITEGKISAKTAVVKERSQKLRRAAIEHYTIDHKIVCSVCGFDFKEVYGELGDGYIQIHHENPIYQYCNDGFEEYISEAIKNMKPLCANCHCIIHRNQNKLVSITELKSVVDKNK